MNILGISAFYHDSAACLIADGDVVAAAHEERFTRVKHDAGFPTNAIKYVLEAGGIKSPDLIAFYDNFSLKRERAVATALAYGYSDNLAISVKNWGKLDDFVGNVRALTGWSSRDIASRLHIVKHHFSHAASAYFVSPFQDAAILTVDGVGEFSTTTISKGAGGVLRFVEGINFPHSLGLMYSAMTHYLGFKVNSGEYKVMGLAPLGEPTFANHLLGHLITLKEDGAFSLNLDYFLFHRSTQMLDSGKFERLIGFPVRREGNPIETHHRNLAASVQYVVELAIHGLAKRAVDTTGVKNLCLAGGVALNCSALGKLRNAGIVDNIFVQPAAGDAGGALGAALAVSASTTGGTAKKINQRFSVYLGPSIDQNKTSNDFSLRGYPHQALSDSELVETIVHALLEGKYVGWVRGRMEWGPRALGSRSIIANPLIPDVQRHLNLRIKKRESFRPFAPVVLEQCVADLFVNPGVSPYMSVVQFLRPELRGEDAEWTFQGKILAAKDAKMVKAAVIHKDWSARLQTVGEAENGLYYLVLKRFFEVTGCPMLINTSFNVRGEPIVCSAFDAYKALHRAELDLLAIENLVFERAKQPVLAVEEFEYLPPD